MKRGLAAAGNPAPLFYSVAACPLGFMLAVASDEGLCAVQFGDSPEALLDNLTDGFPGSTVSADPARMAALCDPLLRYLGGDASVRLTNLPLDVGGTDFQWKVWRLLQEVPAGTTISYAELARRAGDLKAVRAVAHANAANPVAVVIPCHRVVGSDGSLTGYRWGIERKRRLLELEGALPKSGSLF